LIPARPWEGSRSDNSLDSCEDQVRDAIPSLSFPFATLRYIVACDLSLHPLHYCVALTRTLRRFIASPL